MNPPSLKKGDIIAFVSPSSRLNHVFASRIARAKSFLESLDFKVQVIFDRLPVSDPHHLSTRRRCAEIEAAFVNPSVGAIIYVTLLLHAIYNKSNLRTFYGPAVITQLGEYPRPLDFTVNHFLHVLTASSDHPVGAIPRSAMWTQEFLDWSLPESKLRARKLKSSSGWHWLRPGKCVERIFGGCLPSIVQLTGTPYLPSYNDRILFLETPDFTKPDEELPLAFARSNMADLINAGIMTSLAGLVLGRPFQYNEAATKQFEEMVLELLYGTTYPILANVDIGHTDPMLTIPLDTLACLDSEKDRWEILEPATSRRK